ncbi:uncharacterized protein LOC126266814 [Schistocerca gregaria]|uniref:uncharacterized protein LOC126266814 n=1 Tax=Schistocerca gregaria TaxID=7010 RepID=UPI00211F1C76|nr:uncharacterized protein LOC126266814 [Schistocerca gregaria]
MLPRTCITLLFLSLLSAAASVDGGTNSVSGTVKPPPVGTVSSFPGQKGRAPDRKRPASAQGQGMQFRRPTRKPAKQRPARRPQRRPVQQTQGNTQDINGNQASDPWQTPTYLVCYLYPASPVYLDISPNQPFAATNNGAMYPPYIGYKISAPTNAGSGASDDSVNKMFLPQMGYPSPLYPLKLVCPLQQSVSAYDAVSPLPVTQYVDNDSDNTPATNDPNAFVVDTDAGMFYYPYDGESPMPYDNVFGPSGLAPENDCQQRQNTLRNAWYTLCCLTVHLFTNIFDHGPSPQWKKHLLRELHIAYMLFNHESVCRC